MGLARLELATSRLWVDCSNQLSYGPSFTFYFHSKEWGAKDKYLILQNRMLLTVIFPHSQNLKSSWGYPRRILPIHTWLPKFREALKGLACVPEGNVAWRRSSVSRQKKSPNLRKRHACAVANKTQKPQIYNPSLFLPLHRGEDVLAS